MAEITYVNQWQGYPGTYIRKHNKKHCYDKNYGFILYISDIWNILNANFS